MIDEADLIAEQIRKDARQKWFRILAVALVIGLMGWAAWHWGRGVYRQMKEKREVAQAQVFFDRGDYRNALMSTRLALMLNSNSAPGVRIMADLAGMLQSPAALDWRQRLVELEPTPENKLALASVAMQFQNPPFPLTGQILNELAGTATNLAIYHSVATALALRLNHPADAEKHLEIALRLAPTNQTFSLNLAVLHLNATNPATVSAARATLETFLNDTNLGPAAYRSLISERILHGDLTGARNYSTQLLAMAQADLTDRLQNLGILKSLHSPELSGQMKQVQLDVATNAVLVARAAGWMQENGFQSETAAWLISLPADIQSKPPVQVSLANIYLATTNWQDLGRLTAKGDWAELDYLRLAFLSRSWSGLGEALVAEGQWHSAVEKAGDRLGALSTLLDLARRWGMNAAEEDLLRRIVRRYPDALWAQQGLEKRYMAAGDTRQLHQLYTAQAQRLPKHPVIKNNVVATALLLKTNLAASCQMAAEIHGQFPDDPVITSTYAYALHLQGRTAEGLAALRQLPPAQLELPAVALYYGVLLAASGDRERAAHFLAVAERGGPLLPEETLLINQAAGKH